ncbi:MAG: bifunctional metallophosphatase/5'-nucleotidase [Erythrobacter sp.]|nr:MAG: bifunctional metallophosphatase/5'-nucleotidase [Erythrobacter sp.]
MNTKLAAALLSTIALAACTSVPDQSSAPVTVQILAINDFHGNLETPQSETWFMQDGVERRVRLGGAAQLAATLAALRSGNSVTVAAGDLIGASPLISSLFLDEPTIKALSTMGLDIASVGNHEFDRGTDELRRMQDGGCDVFTLRAPCAVEPFVGAEFAYLAANVVDSAGETFLPATEIREIGGARIGFIGMTLEGTANLVSAQATEGLRFLDEAETANRHAAELRAQGVDTVVVLVHEGADVDPYYNLTGCPGLSGPIVAIAEALNPEISLVVSGHTHQAYVCTVPTTAGSEVLLTSGGRFGGFVTDIALTIDPATDTVVSVTGRNVPVDGNAGSDPALAALVATYAEASGPVASRAVGPIAPANGEQGEDCGDRPAQGFVADAYLHAANSAPGVGADLALVNSGGVRTNLDGANDGVLTFGELSAMAPFGNGTIVLEMTGAEFRNVLEQQFCEENGTTTICDSVLIPSAGSHYTADPSKPALQRITSVTINGQPLDPDHIYRVVTNSFLVGGGDGFAQFAAVPQVANVGFDIDALEAYVATGTVSVPVCGRVRNLAAAD